MESLHARYDHFRDFLVRGLSRMAQTLASRVWWIGLVSFLAIPGLVTDGVFLPRIPVVSRDGVIRSTADRLKACSTPRAL